MAFYAHHGYYVDERKRGNNYTVDIYIRYDLEEAGRTDDLHKALNYETVYAIVNEEMDDAQHLIETVARNIALRVQKAFPETENIQVKVKKFAPELGGPVNNAHVIYELP